MIEQLNQEQRAAVTLEPQHALILAGAGSGKTKVLTTRMAWLIQTGQVSPFGLLAVTFTNKAAKEMLHRLGGLLPINVKGMWVGTFHGLCNRMLRTHYREAALPQSFQILDSSEQLSAIKRLMKNNNFDTERYPPKQVVHFINHAKEKAWFPDDVPAFTDLDRFMVEAYRLYREQCDREGVVDFAELLFRSYVLLKSNVFIREHYQRRFSHILVDEFQDTNDLQYNWLRLLAGTTSSIFAVGDDDQSIYAFRGANIGNLQAFEKEYAKGNMIRLEQNYRSYGHILNAANGLIANNTKRLGKELWTDQGEGEPVRIIEQGSDILESQWIVEEIKALLNDGFSRDEVAILYRSNAQSRVLEHTLFSNRIPYKVYGGLRFFERQEVKHALAYLRLIANLDDDTSFLRVVNFPTRGIGARTLELLNDAAQSVGCSLSMAAGAVTGKSGAKLVQFVQSIRFMQTQIAALGLAEAMDFVVEASGLKDYYLQEKDGSERLENLSELVNAAKAFSIEEGYEGAPSLAVFQPFVEHEDPMTLEFRTEAMSPLVAFLSHASLESGENQAQSGEAAVQLMTVHAAKGLEFKAVFISGLEEGLFPHENSISDEGGLEEERRLMYVAITRARERLYISLAQTRMLHGQTRYSMRSRFLQEIPEATLKWLTPKTEEYSLYSSAGGGVSQNRYSGGNDAFGRTQSANRIEARAPRIASPGVQIGEQLFKIGQTVYHARFGEGTILQLNGQGTDAQAQIAFRDQGIKNLALAIAKLDIK